MDRIREQENDALLEIASGRRIHSLSEEPATAASWVQNRLQIKETDQFLRNLSGLRAGLQATDSALNSVVTTLTRAISLGVQGANGTLSAQNRLVVAQEVRSLQQQLVDLANHSFQGTYVFAGTAVTTQPFVLDPGDPAGVRYDGNSAVNSVEIADGQIVPINLPGNQIFRDPAADVFLAMQNLIDALESGTGIEAANVEVQKAFGHVNALRTFYGTTLGRLDTTELFLSREKFEFSRQENDLVGADLAASVTRLVQAENARDALLAAGGRISQLSLLDFLR